MDDVTRGVLIGAVAGGMPAVLQMLRDLFSSRRDATRAEAERAAQLKAEAFLRRRTAIEEFLEWRSQAATKGYSEDRPMSLVLCQLERVRIHSGAELRHAIDELRQRFQVECGKPGAKLESIQLDETNLRDAMRHETQPPGEAADFWVSRFPPQPPRSPQTPSKTE